MTCLSNSTVWPCEEGGKKTALTSLYWISERFFFSILKIGYITTFTHFASFICKFNSVFMAISSQTQTHVTDNALYGEKIASSHNGPMARIQSTPPLFSRVHAPLQPALSVRPLIGRLVPILLFFMISFLWPHCSYLTGLVTSNMAPAHPHATSVALFLILSLFLVLPFLFFFRFFFIFTFLLIFL